MKRQRGRGRKPGGGNPGNRPFESNGPDVKIRGTAAQIYEKYMQYARDAQSSGDRVKFENYLQHAEHYFRIMAATMPREQRFAQQSGEGGFMSQGEPREMEEASPDAMRVVDEAEGEDESEEFAGDGEEPEVRDEEPQGQIDAREGGRNRRRRNRHRNRPQDGEGGGERPERANGGDPEARSALDALAARQAAVAGG